MMNVSRITSRYLWNDDRPSPSIKPTARASWGARMTPQPVHAALRNVVKTPSVEPIRMPVHG